MSVTNSGHGDLILAASMLCTSLAYYIQTISALVNVLMQ